MSNEYLIKEYELNYEQLRFYDERHSNTLKYLFSLTSAVATAQFAIYKLTQGFTNGFFLCQIFLSTVVFIATLLLYLSMVQNRLYFVYTARQLNAIRGYLMTTEASEFHNNQLYTSTDFPALKPSSVHTFQLLSAALISSIFAGISAYALGPTFGQAPCLCAALLTLVIVAIIEIAGGFIYLATNGKKSADHAIHMLKPNSQNKESGD
jgi:hypothetical protein